MFEGVEVALPVVDGFVWSPLRLPGDEPGFDAGDSAGRDVEFLEFEGLLTSSMGFRISPELFSVRVEDGFVTELPLVDSFVSGFLSVAGLSDPVG